MSDNQFQVDLERIANAPVSEGVHLFKIVDGVEAEGEKGPYWRFTLACLDPSDDGKTTQLIVSLTPQARWRLEIFLDAVGAPPKGGATIDKFIGRQFRGRVSHEDYQGRPQARINEMFPASSSPAAAKKEEPSVVVKTVSAEPTVKPAAEQGLPADVADQDPLPF